MNCISCVKREVESPLPFTIFIVHTCTGSTSSHVLLYCDVCASYKTPCSETRFRAVAPHKAEQHDIICVEVFCHAFKALVA